MMPRITRRTDLTDAGRGHRMVSTIVVGGVSVVNAETAEEIEREVLKRTTRDSEDWAIVCDREIVHMLSLREVDEAGGRMTIVKKGRGARSMFNKIVESMGPDHNIGCVTVVLPEDSRERGGEEMLAWLVAKSEEKRFNIIAASGPASTEEAIASLGEPIVGPDVENHTLH
jgi:hypothetical protein